MLYLHETHRVVGEHADDFEAAWRGQLGGIAEGGDARLLWFLHQTHGTGPSYVVVTITALRDGAAWERYARRLEAGNLKAWARKLDAMRHHSESKVLGPVAWSALQDVD